MLYRCVIQIVSQTTFQVFCTVYKFISVLLGSKYAFDQIIDFEQLHGSVFTIFVTRIYSLMPASKTVRIRVRHYYTIGEATPGSVRLITPPLQMENVY